MRSIANVLFVVMFVFVSASSAYATNKTGKFEEKCAGMKYWGYVPEDCAEATDLPLVVTFHSSNSNPENFMMTWQNTANKHKIAILAPECTGDNWSQKDEEYVEDVIVDFRIHCKFDKKRIFFTGFCSGAQFALDLNIKKKCCNGLGLVCGGYVDEKLRKEKLAVSKSLPILYLCGEGDNNLEYINKAIKKLKDAGFKVELKLEKYEKQDPNQLHYPDNGTEMLWEFFENTSVMHRIKKIKIDADKAYEEKNLVEAYDFFFQIRMLFEQMTATEYKENKVQIDEYIKDVKEKLEKLEEIWKEKEPDAFKLIDKTLKLLLKNKKYDAAKNFSKILEKHPETKAAEFAKRKLEEILYANQDIADKLAGSKPKSDLKKAESILEKSSCTEDGKKEALGILEQIVKDFPFTSYAEKAKRLIWTYDK